MQAIAAYLGGWGQQTTEFDFECQNCGHLTTIENDNSQTFHSLIIVLFLLAEIGIFIADDNPSYLAYLFWTVLFGGLLYLFKCQNILYPVVEK